MWTYGKHRLTPLSNPSSGGTTNTKNGKSRAVNAIAPENKCEMEAPGGGFDDWCINTIARANKRQRTTLKGHPRSS